jgi:hypothetical protein
LPSCNRASTACDEHRSNVSGDDARINVPINARINVPLTAHA